MVLTNDEVDGSSAGNSQHRIIELGVTASLVQTSVDLVAVGDGQALVQADVDLGDDVLMFLVIPLALNSGVLAAQSILDGVEDIIKVVEVSWSYSALEQIVVERILVMQFENGLEIFEFVVEFGDADGAGAVLGPLVLPEAVLAGVGVDVGPVGFQVRKKSFNRFGVEFHVWMAKSGALFAELGRPQAMDGPIRFGG